MKKTAKLRQWQENGQIGMDWYFELAEKFGTERIIFNSVQLESPLFQRLTEKTQEHKLAPVYVVTAEQFCASKNLLQQMQQGVHYTVLIYSPLSTEMICRVRDLESHLSQLSFVILARKDWNVRNCYRSVPHFMRHRLFVDFPVSMHETDPFYEPSELTSIRQKFEKDFLDKEVQSYCPNLGIHNEWGKKNISYFSQPRKLLNEKPKVSIIALNPEALQPLLESQVLQKSPEDFEILITRVAGQKTKVIPKVKSVVTTRYWAHPIDQNKPVSKKILANFTASQADGDILVFLDPKTDPSLDGLFSVLLSGEANFGKLLMRKGLFVFNRADFFKAGGFDDLLATWGGERVRLLDELYPELTEAEQNRNLGPLLEKVDNSCDQLLLAHQFANQIDDFSFLGERTPLKRVISPKFSVFLYLQGQIFLFFKWIEFLSQKHGWKFSPLRLRHFYRTRLWKYNIFRYIYHYWKMHAWRVSPLRLRHYLRPYVWRFNPWVYAWPWKLVWQIRHLPQRIYGWWVRAYWTAFRLLFPLRKIYYFSQFQFEKRVLKLHRKTKPLQRS